MNWFLDMCIIIFYASDTNDIKSINSKNFVKDKKDKKFLVCCYVAKENMPKWIKRQGIITKLVGKKILNPSCELKKSEGYDELYSQDKIILKKFLAEYSSSKNKQEYYEKMRRSRDLIIRKINYFMSKLIDKEVVPVKDVYFELKSTLFTFLQNHSDAMTLASGIQHHQSEELIILTGDKHDWNKSNLEWTFDSRPDLAKKYPKIPEIKYIQNM